MKTSLPKFVRVMKGNATAFTCLGNWYDLADPESMESLREMLKIVTNTADRRMAVSEIEEARAKNA